MTVETEADLRGLLACGRLVRQVFQRMRAAAHPGVTTAELDRIAERGFREAGADSAPRFFYDFPGETCISVNEEAAHGIPATQRRLKRGDLLNIDVSAVLNGYVADLGESFVVGGSGPRHRAKTRICRAVREAVAAAITCLRPGASLNVIGEAVQAVADRYGYAIVDNLGSHGVGRALHEEPSYVPKPNPRERRKLEDGMVLTIEPFLTTGRPWVTERPDGWTLAVEPNVLVAQFEQTVVVRADGPLVVTAA